MIIKSYIAEQDKKIFTNKLLLIYGENIGLIEDFKKKLSQFIQTSEVNNFNQANIIKTRKCFIVKYLIFLFFKNKKFF